MKKTSGSNKIWYALATCLIMVFLATGCTTTKAKYSGWLETDYTKLKQSPEDPGAMVWLTTDEELGKYDKVMIDDVAIFVDPDLPEERERMNPDVINQMTTHFKQILTKEFSKDYEVVDKPGKGVVRMRTALTAVELNKKDLKVYQFVPVALVLTAATEAAGKRNRLAVVNMEGIVQDSLTGKTLGMVVQQYASETSVQTAQEMTVKDALPVLEHWAQKAKKKFDRAHGK